MRVLSQFFQGISKDMPVRMVTKASEPRGEPQVPIDDRAVLIVAPDRSEGRLVSGPISDLFDGHWVEMYLPNRGRVRAFTNIAAWEIAVRVIAEIDSLSAIVKPDQKLYGSGATVHYPRGKDYGICINEGQDG